jgi:NADPH:quinone reductase-like Zn-dependent oxidoreductase
MSGGFVDAAIPSAVVCVLEWLRSSATPPLILGCEVAGTVEAVGDNVKDFAPGDDVYGYLRRQGFEPLPSIRTC